MTKKKPFTTGSGSIFLDLGFSEEEAVELSLKSLLFDTLQAALKSTPGTQTEIAERLGIPQPKISDILKGKQAGFSIERITNLLLKLDYEICFDVYPAPSGSKGRVRGRTNRLAV
jgi:predicted XRE-type DNA-binding protein